MTNITPTTTDTLRPSAQEVANSIKAQVQGITEELTNALKQAQARSQSLFEAASKTLFDLDPRLESFGWDQYTPYFNDGESCEFAVCDYSIQINGRTEDDVIYGGDFELEEGDPATIWDEAKPETGYGPNAEPNPAFRADTAALVKSIRALINGIPEDTMLGLFGDHKRIVVSRDKPIAVEEFGDHD